MARQPLAIRLLPAGARRAAKAALRPYAESFLRAFLPAHMPAQAGRGRHDGQAAFLSLAAADAKHIPVRPDRAHYILPKEHPDEPKWRDGFATPPKRLWHGYAPTLEQVMAIGERNVARMRKLLRTHGGDIDAGDRVLDFGCAAGFMIRRLTDVAARGEVWGVDLSGPHIAWCMRHLSPPFRFVLTSSFPSLPFCEGYFDLIYCGSVFSHIGESVDAWLLELARIIRPGGRLYLTMVTKEAMWEYFRRWPEIGFSKSMQRAFTREQLGSDFAVAVYGRGPGSHAVYDLEWFRAKCAPAFEVRAVVPNVYTFQPALVLQRKAWQRRG